MVAVEWFCSPRCDIYLAYALSSWGDRIWYFAGGIFMKDLEGSQYENLKLTGVFTFAMSGSVLMLGATVGQWVDNTARLKAVQIALLTQNLSLALCCAVISVMFLQWDSLALLWDGWCWRILQSAIIIVASVSQLANVGITIILQKDWIIILADGNLDILARINSIFRTIDLTAQVVAPIVVGLLQDQVSKLCSSVAIALWNILSACLEYYLFWSIYKENPRLSQRVIPMENTASCVEDYSDTHIYQERNYNSFSDRQMQQTGCFHSWHLYFKHQLRFMGISLALLYMTVLGFDATTTAYGNTQISSLMVGVAQALAAVCGVMGSLSFPSLRKCMRQEFVGLLGLVLQITALTACVTSIWLPGSPFNATSLSITWEPSGSPEQRNSSHCAGHQEPHKSSYKFDSVMFLLGGIILSRFGLWLADITITQVMQEHIPEHRRGVINGIQNSLNMGMDMLKSVLVILYSYPEQFGLLVIVSFIFVFSGCVSYTIFLYETVHRERQQQQQQQSQQDTPHRSSIFLFDK